MKASQTTKRPFSMRAFTLTELLVSVAILAGMMAMVSMIFTSATKSSGQAQATTAMYRQLRQITESIRRDLDATLPGERSKCVLGVARVDVLAYASAADLATGRDPIRDRADPRNDWHRADVLMLVAQRSFDPYIYQDDPSSPIAKFAGFRHVVYGHANIGKLNTTGSGWVVNSIRNMQPDVSMNASPIPASQWHLARRVVGFANDSTEFDKDANGQIDTGINNVARWPLTDNVFTGRTDTDDQFADVCWLPLDNLLDTPSNGPGPGLFKYDANGLLTSFFLRLRPPASATEEKYHWESNAYYVLKASGTPFNYWWKWWRYNSGIGNDEWVRTENSGGTTLTMTSPARPVDPGVAPDLLAGVPAYQTTTPKTPAYWPEWFYTGPDSRTVLDPSPPAGKEKRLAAYFLPGCSEFKVEFTYDDPREIAIDKTSKNRPPVLMDWDGDTTATSTSPQTPAPRPIHWESVPDRERWIWYGLGQNPSDYKTSGDLRDYTQPYRWPRAIRITLRVYDPAGRLTEPITQTIVHVFQ